MSQFSILADLSPVPILVVGGAGLLLIAGVFIAFAAALFGWVKKKKHQHKDQPEADAPRFPDLSDHD